MTNFREENWETRFNDRFTNHGEFVYNRGGYPVVCGELKRFISQELQSHLRETEKAFGGCKKCYGKGYATQRRTVTGSPDFIGDRGFKIDKVWMNFCTCGRGKQLKSLLGRLKGLGGNKQ